MVQRFAPIMNPGGAVVSLTYLASEKIIPGALLFLQRLTHQGSGFGAPLQRSDPLQATSLVHMILGWIARACLWGGHRCGVCWCWEQRRRLVVGCWTSLG